MLECNERKFGFKVGRGLIGLVLKDGGRIYLPLTVWVVMVCMVGNAIC